MPRFICKAGNTQGQTLTIAINSNDKASARAEIESRGLVFLDVTLQNEGSRFINTFKRVKANDVLVFTKQLFVLVRAGLPMVQALEMLAEDVPNRHFKKVIENLTQSVESGESLSESLSRHPDVFEPIYIHTVKAGEEGSNLEGVMQKLIDFQDSSIKLKKRIINSLIYPAILVFVSTVIIVFLIGYVVPSFAQVFSELGSKLPWLTANLLSFSHLFKIFLPYIAVGIFALFFAYRMVVRIPGTRRIIDRVKLGLPVFGLIVEKISILRMCQVLKLLIISGVPLVEAVKAVATTITNYEYRERFEKAAEYISVGHTFSDALKKYNLGRSMVAKLVNVGERSSDLPTMLDNISDLYEDELNTLLEILLSLIEPALLIVMGAVACLIILSLFVPILQMSMVLK